MTRTFTAVGGAVVLCLAHAMAGAGPADGGPVLGLVGT
jgi:hypothetical protein